MRFFFLSILFLGMGLILSNLPILYFSVLNLGVFLFWYVRFLIRLYHNRFHLILPELPLRLDDSKTCRDLAKDPFPSEGGLIFSFGVNMQWGSFRHLRLQNNARMERGVYKVHSCFIKVEDPFGFFRFRKKGQEGHSLTIYPTANEEVRSIPSDNLSDSADFTRRTILKDQAFFESRPYYPGDDPRRINWNLLARYGDFFVKEGYRMKPEDQSLLILLNGNGSPAAVDVLMRECRIWMESLLKNGTGLTVFSSGKETASLFSPGTDPVQIQDFLASVPPLPLNGHGIARVGSFSRVLFFSTLSGLPEIPEILSMGRDTVFPILVLPVSEDDDSPGGIIGAYRKGGWHVYQKS